MVEFTVSAALLSVFAGAVLPVLTGLFTKELASGALKASILALLSAVTGLVNGAITMGGAFTGDAIVAAAVTWMMAVATYYGYLKPAGVTEKVNAKTSSFGVGSN